MNWIGASLLIAAILAGGYWIAITARPLQSMCLERPWLDTRPPC